MKGAINLANCNRCNCNGNGNGNGRRRRRCGCMRMCRGSWESFPFYTGPCPNLEGCYSCGGSTGGKPCSCNCTCNCTCDNEETEAQTCDCRPHRHCWRRCRRCPYDCDYEDENTCKCKCKCTCECDCNDEEEDEAEEDETCKCKCRKVCRCCPRPRPWPCRPKPCCCIFSAYLPMALGPNGIIPLARCNPSREDNFDVNCGLVTLEKAGTYLATYTVRVPETVALDTTVTLNVDNASQSTAVTQVLTETGASSSSYTGQAIFHAEEGDTVSLRTSEAINATETATQPMFTLSLVNLEE